MSLCNISLCPEEKGAFGFFDLPRKATACGDAAGWWQHHLTTQPPTNCSVSDEVADSVGDEHPTAKISPATLVEFVPVCRLEAFDDFLDVVHAMPLAAYPTVAASG